MSGIFGIWKHELIYDDTAISTTLAIRDDGSYETQMIYAIGGGCQQHIYHYGTHEISETALRLNFEAGKTEMKQCDDASKNFARRDFTDAETDEAKSLLAQEIRYTVIGDTLVTRVDGPNGEMEVIYNRQTE